MASAATCDEIRFPVDISRGSSGGPMWSTIIIKPDDGSGAESRTPVWDIGRRRFEFAAGGLDRSLARELMAFWYCRRGEVHDFRWKDWTDYQATDEPLTLDGDTAQLVKTYTNGPVSHVRPIYKPARVSDGAPAITMTLNGSPFTYFAIDENSGMVYFTPGTVTGGDELAWSGEFDIPVRFDMKETDLEYRDVENGVWDGAVVLEDIRPPLAVEVDTPLLAPSSLTATVFNYFTIDLEWVDVTTGETEFRIERSDDGVTGWVEIGTAAADAEAYSDDTCDDETTYYYRVRAYRASDTSYSTYTNIASDTTPIGLIDPASLAHKELYANSDVSLSGGTHGDAIASWADLSGNARDLLQSNAAQKPLLQKTSNQSPSGKVLVRFDGIDDTVGSGLPAIWPTNARGHTFLFYGRLRQTTAPPGPFNFAQLMSDGTTGGAGIVFQKNPNGPPTAVGADLHNTTIYGPWQMFAVVMKTDGTQQGYRALNGGDVIALSENPAWTWNPALLSGITFSGNIVNNGALNADVAVVLWVSEEHDIDTLRGLRNFLADQFGEE